MATQAELMKQTQGSIPRAQQQQSQQSQQQVQQDQVNQDLLNQQIQAQALQKEIEEWNLAQRLVTQGRIYPGLVGPNSGSLGSKVREILRSGGSDLTSNATADLNRQRAELETGYSKVINVVDGKLLFKSDQPTITNSSYSNQPIAVSTSQSIISSNPFNRVSNTADTPFGRASAGGSDYYNYKIATTPANLSGINIVSKDAAAASQKLLDSYTPPKLQNIPKPSLYAEVVSKDPYVSPRSIPGTYKDSEGIIRNFSNNNFSDTDNSDKYSANNNFFVDAPYGQSSIEPLSVGEGFRSKVRRLTGISLPSAKQGYNLLSKGQDYSDLQDSVPNDPLIALGAGVAGGVERTIGMAASAGSAGVEKALTILGVPETVTEQPFIIPQKVTISGDIPSGPFPKFYDSPKQISGEFSIEPFKYSPITSPKGAGEFVGAGINLGGQILAIEGTGGAYLAATGLRGLGKATDKSLNTGERLAGGFEAASSLGLLGMKGLVGPEASEVINPKLNAAERKLVDESKNSISLLNSDLADNPASVLAFKSAPDAEETFFRIDKSGPDGSRLIGFGRQETSETGVDKFLGAKSKGFIQITTPQGVKITKPFAGVTLQEAAQTTLEKPVFNLDNGLTAQSVLEPPIVDSIQSNLGGLEITSSGGQVTVPRQGIGRLFSKYKVLTDNKPITKVSDIFSIGSRVDNDKVNFAGGRTFPLQKYVSPEGIVSKVPEFGSPETYSPEYGGTLLERIPNRNYDLSLEGKGTGLPEPKKQLLQSKNAKPAPTEIINKYANGKIPLPQLTTQELTSLKDIYGTSSIPGALSGAAKLSTESLRNNLVDLAKPAPTEIRPSAISGVITSATNKPFMIPASAYTGKGTYERTSVTGAQPKSRTMSITGMAIQDFGIPNNSDKIGKNQFFATNTLENVKVGRLVNTDKLAIDSNSLTRAVKLKDAFATLGAERLRDTIIDRTDNRIDSGLEQGTKTLQRVNQQTRQEQQPANSTKVIQIVIPGSVTPVPQVKIPSFSINRPKKLFQPSSKKQILVIAEAKRRGIFTPISGPVSVEEGLNRGIRVTRESLARTFRLTPAKGVSSGEVVLPFSPNASIYRSPTGKKFNALTFVEKNPYALRGSPRAVNEIISSRKGGGIKFI